MEDRTLGGAFGARLRGGDDGCARVQLPRRRQRERFLGHTRHAARHHRVDLGLRGRRALDPPRHGEGGTQGGALRCDGHPRGHHRPHRIRLHLRRQRHLFRAELSAAERVRLRDRRDLQWRGRRGFLSFAGQPRMVPLRLPHGGGARFAATLLLALPHHH